MGAITKGALAEALAEGTELKKSECLKVFDELGGGCDEGGEEDGQGDDPRRCDDQDSREARHQGRKAGDVRQGGDGCREASEDRGEGLPGCCHQEGHLKCLNVLCSSWRRMLV